MKKVEKKNNKGIVLIIVLSIVGVLLYISPYVLLIIGFMVDLDSEDYKVINNKIILEDDKAYISNLSHYYDTNTECFVITYEIINDDYDESITVDFNLYDEDNYIIGVSSETTDLEEDNKYKVKSYYCDSSAKNVKNYKLKDINAY